MKISDIQWDISKEFGFNLSTQRLRRLEDNGLFTPKREKGNNYRIYSQDEGGRIKTIIALSELGLEGSEIEGILNGKKEILYERVKVLKKLTDYLRGELSEQ